MLQGFVSKVIQGHRNNSVEVGVKKQGSEKDLLAMGSDKDLVKDLVKKEGKKKQQPYRFTVTEDALKQIKSIHGEKQRRKAWSPTWASTRASVAPVKDVESLVEAYVELVCDDLRTKGVCVGGCLCGLRVPTPWARMVLACGEEGVAHQPCGVTDAHREAERERGSRRVQELDH
jgi:hypothetical protein